MSNPDEIYKLFSCFASMINYHHKTFRPSSTSANGDIDVETIFIFSQDEDIVSASYAGGKIISGHLIAVKDENGILHMRYHHVNTDNKLMTGICISVPEVRENGKLILHETWRWTCDDESKGESLLEEI